MANLQKVIQAFENCTDPEMNDDDETCVDCIRAGECPWDDCQERGKKLIDIPLSLVMAALELLKAQKPILLKNQHKPYGLTTNANSPWISRCPKCGKKIEGKQTRFCKYCGQAVKWND